MLSEAIGIKEINLGGTKAGDHKRQLSKALFISDEEEVMLKEMMDEGMQMNVQMIPAEKSVDVKSLL